MSWELSGRMDEEEYQKAVECVQFLRTERTEEYSFVVLELFPAQWEAHKSKTKETSPPAEGDKIGSFTVCIVKSPEGKVFVDNEFVTYISRITRFRVFHYDEHSTDPDSYRNAAQRRYYNFMKGTGNAYCYFIIKIGEEVLQDRMVFELFVNQCPRTCDNFRHLCIGDLGVTHDPNVTEEEIHLSYKGKQFFRIVKDGWVQGGDIIADRGNSGYSIYGPSMPSECFDVPHTGEGVLGMATHGRDTAASQFYLTVGNAGHQWMNGRYVAFGRIIEGLNVLRQIHNTPTKPNEMPAVKITIHDCGEVDLSSFRI